MVRKEGAKNQIYFIDFERVEIKNRLLPDQKMELLAKLNRVGREVSIKDRLRFLSGYLEVETDCNLIVSGMIHVWSKLFGKYVKRFWLNINSLPSRRTPIIGKPGCSIQLFIIKRIG